MSVSDCAIGSNGNIEGGQQSVVVQDEVSFLLHECSGSSNEVQGGVDGSVSESCNVVGDGGDSGEDLEGAVAQKIQSSVQDRVARERQGTSSGNLIVR